MSVPPYIDRTSIHQRLPIIFPEGVPQRTYCVREAAASTVFTSSILARSRARMYGSRPNKSFA
jgi:hypothetical protein